VAVDLATRRSSYLGIQLLVADEIKTTIDMHDRQRLAVQTYEQQTVTMVVYPSAGARRARPDRPI
jgi:hypothetical protein